MSRTNIDLNDFLVREGMALYGFKTKKEFVNHALGEAVRLARQRSILELKGKVKWHGNLDDMRSFRTFKKKRR